MATLKTAFGANAPSNKVTVGAVAGGLSAVVVWALNTYLDAQIPAEIGMSGSTVLIGILQWITRD